MIRRALLALCAPALLGAQGGWVMKKTQTPRDPKLRAMVAHMNEVMAVLRRDPDVDRPAKYTILADIRASQSGPTKMVFGVVSGIMMQGPSADGEGLEFSVAANSIGCTVERADLRDADAEFYSPLPSKPMHGFPMYHDHDCIVITKRPGPLTVPVSRERAARAVIKRYAEQAAVVAAAQRELAAMSPAERAEPAILDVGTVTALTMGAKAPGPLLPKTSSETAFPLVIFNPAFYDRTRLSDVQVLTVNFPCLDGTGSPWCAGFKDVFEHMRDKLDWDGLLRLVTP